MPESRVNYISQDDTAIRRTDDGSETRLFNNFRNRLPSFTLGLPSVSGIRERAFGQSTRKDGSAPTSRVSRSTETGHLTGLAGRAGAVIIEDDDASLGRRRSRSQPPERHQQSLRKRAILMKDSAMLDLRARANAFDLSRLPSFHFSLPFSDSSPPPQTQRDAIDNIRDFQADTDNISMTSLEVEALATDTKAENNRLRGIIEGLPKIGIPGFGPNEPFAGLSEATKDLNIVVLGGYRGSILRSTEDQRMLWIPVKVGLGIRKVDLELPLEQNAEREASKTIYPDGMLTHIGPVDISRRLLKKLRDMQDRGFCKVREFDFDWRLGGEFLSEQLIKFLQGLDGKALVVAHSLGGLITMHALNKRPDLFRGVLFAGTPFHGCPNILGPFRYGDGVLLNRSILNAQTNFSMRSSFILLPTHKRCFVDVDSGKELLIDFFDAETWAEYGLSPMVARDGGATDVGEGTDVNGFMASGGIGGPKLGNSTDDNAITKDAAHLNVPQTNKPSTSSSSPFSPRTPSPSPGPTRSNCIEYLTRTLAATLAFKASLAHDPGQNYPPIALLRSNSTPTVRGCNVHGYKGIKAGDYSKFIFSPGDGVVTYASSDLLALDERWSDVVVCNVENDRGHIGLLGDLSGVSTCLEAILAADHTNTTKVSKSATETTTTTTHTEVRDLTSDLFKTSLDT